METTIEEVSADPPGDVGKVQRPKLSAAERGKLIKKPLRKLHVHPGTYLLGGVDSEIYSPRADGKTMYIH